MSEHHKIDFNLNFSFDFKAPLKIVLKLDSDAAEAQRLADQLKTSADALKTSIEQNQPKT